MLKLKLIGNIIIEHNQSNISLDPIRKTCNFENNFISHAHKDHIGPRKNEFSSYLTTEPTLEIANALFTEKKSGQFLEYNKQYKIDDLEYKIIN